MQARKKSVMWERRLSTIYHCCADMPWEESCAENPNIGTSILAAVISDLVWGTFQTQGAHNEGLASHEEPAVKLKEHVNCSDIPTDFCCFRDAILIPRSKEELHFLLRSLMHHVPTWALSGAFYLPNADISLFRNYSSEFKLGMISQMAQLPKKAESELDQILSWGKSVHQCKIQAWDGLKFI